jgi:DNA-binding transcriptional regulator/RsmH inhibitor MraZ
VVIVGALGKFEIWDKDVFKDLEESEDSFTQAQEFYESEEIRV